MRLAHVPKSLMFGPILAAFLAAVPGVSLAATAPQNATITITDAGFNPASVTVGVGASVTWNNTGSNVHSSTDPGGAFNSGGLGNGQSFSVNLNNPGTYNYSSAPDCQNGNTNASFNCSATIVVVPAGAPVNAPASTAPSAPVASSAPQTTVAPVSQAPQANGTVNISDTTFSPTNVTIVAGGTVTWIDQGTGVHSATTPTSGPQAFDTGGLSTGQSVSVNFPTTGTFVYSSAPDCLSGASNNPSFACSTGYLVTVVPAGTVPTAAGAPAAATAPAAAAPSAAAAPLPANTVTMNEQYGFSPNPITVPVGGSVTFINQGANVHSVVQDGGGFDSGGLSTGQQFSFTFTSAGTYTYHSSTEPVYIVDSTGNTILSYQYTGTVIVQ